MVACHAGVFPDQCTRKVRAPRRRVAGNTRPPRGEDQCHRDESPGSASADRAGETGKLYPEQGQIGGRNRGPTTPGRRRVAKPSGRPHETAGDRRPRWMTVAAAKAAVQNSAYRPPSWHTSCERSARPPLISVADDCPIDRRSPPARWPVTGPIRLLSPPTRQVTHKRGCARSKGATLTSRLTIELEPRSSHALLPLRGGGTRGAMAPASWLGVTPGVNGKKAAAAMAPAVG
jgi:hypothetical protein